MTPAVIGASHVLCSIGRGTGQVWASARAGIGRITSSQVIDRHFEPIAMGLVPEDALAPLDPELEKLPLPSRARRMLRLATPSLTAVLAEAGRPVPVFIGLPDLDAADAPWLAHVPAYLQTQAGIPIDRSRSVVVARGRASALMALEQALAALTADPETPVVVGGVDTYLDLRLLATLDGEQRILGSRVMDGFIPGEGAGFFVLSSESSAPRGDGPRAVVTTAASAMDPGHRYGDDPARGEGLAQAIELARQRMPPPAPIATFAGFNGENFEAKLWGVARLRHNDLFADPMAMDHPADKYGDAGAATGAILLALAAQALVTGTRTGPALVWAASDREPRACAIVSVGHS
jgi:3-oxoacyl-[acyl-carrier-protein] synthase-1